MKFLTIKYICSTCKFVVKVKTKVPNGKECHALSYNQGIGPETCLRCKQRKSVENCKCTHCSAAGGADMPIYHLPPACPVKE